LASEIVVVSMTCGAGVHGWPAGAPLLVVADTTVPPEVNGDWTGA
jgi:hypothetical protein